MVLQQTMQQQHPNLGLGNTVLLAAVYPSVASNTIHTGQVDKMTRRVEPLLAEPMVAPPSHLITLDLCIAPAYPSSVEGVITEYSS